MRLHVGEGTRWGYEAAHSVGYALLSDFHGLSPLTPVKTGPYTGGFPLLCYTLLCITSTPARYLEKSSRLLPVTPFSIGAVVKWRRGCPTNKWVKVSNTNIIELTEREGRGRSILQELAEPLPSMPTGSGLRTEAVAAWGPCLLPHSWDPQDHSPVGAYGGESMDQD